MSKFFAAVAASLAVALAFSAPALADKGSGGGQKGEMKVEGTVSAVDAAAGTVSITSGGKVVTVTVTATTKVERNGNTATLAAFKLGDRGQALYSASGVASKVQATGP